MVNKMNVKKYLAYAMIMLFIVGSPVTVWYLLVTSPWKKGGDEPTQPLRTTTQSLRTSSSWFVSSPTYVMKKSRVRCPFSCVNIGGCRCAR